MKTKQPVDQQEEWETTFDQEIWNKFDLGFEFRSSLRGIIKDFIRQQILIAEVRGFEKANKAKNEAYGERNQLVAVLAKLYPSHLFRHDNDPAWEREWLWGVCIHFPDFQARWHIHSSERNILFKGMKWKQKCKWDEHTTEEKYLKLSQLSATLKELKL